MGGGSGFRVEGLGFRGWFSLSCSEVHWEQISEPRTLKRNILLYGQFGERHPAPLRRRIAAVWALFRCMVHCLPTFEVQVGVKRLLWFILCSVCFWHWVSGRGIGVSVDVGSVS